MRKPKNPNRQGFMNHVNTIKNIESDKDTFLEAARLERHESRREPLKPSDIIKIIAILGAAAVLCTALALGYFSGNFVPTLIGAILLIIILSLFIVGEIS